VIISFIITTKKYKDINDIKLFIYILI